MKKLTYKDLNKGWTKAKILKQFKKYNNGTKAGIERPTGAFHCAYQDDKGNRCAIGAFIPDGHAALESRFAVWDVLSNYADLIPLMPFQDFTALEALQNAHDNADKTHKGDTHKAVEDFLNQHNLVRAK